MIHLWGGSLWLKDRMVTNILFDLCLFKHLSPVSNFGDQSLGTFSLHKVRKILQFPEPPPPKGVLFTAVSWVYHAHVLTSRGLYIWPLVHVSSPISNNLVAALVNVLGNVHTFKYKYLAYNIPETEMIQKFVNFVTSNEIWLWQTDFIIASKILVLE